eukprot:5212810-Pleurochrysis_carterae.AAC.1
MACWRFTQTLSDDRRNVRRRAAARSLLRLQLDRVAFELASKKVERDGLREQIAGRQRQVLFVADWGGEGLWARTVVGAAILETWRSWTVQSFFNSLVQGTTPPRNSLDERAASESLEAELTALRADFGRTSAERDDQIESFNETVEK